MLQIDVVYTWVNGDCYQFREQVSKYADEIDFNRYASSDEIIYSLYSIYIYAAWIRKIFIILADYQQLDISALPIELKNKIVFIKHSEIIEKKYLPTFSNRLIEASIYKIKQLSEYFLYFNDDMFLGADVQPADFFFAGSKPYFFYGPRFLQGNRIDVNIRNNTRDVSFAVTRKMIFSSRYKLKKWFPYYEPIHQLYPLRKSVMKIAFETFQSSPAFSYVFTSRFRNYSSAIPIYLAQLYGVQHNEFVMKKFKSEIFISLNESLKTTAFQKISVIKPKLFCINNDLPRNNEKVKVQLYKFLSTYYGFHLN